MLKTALGKLKSPLHSNAFLEAEKTYRKAYEFAQELGDKPL
jgi:hypothetical protein